MDEDERIEKECDMVVNVVQKYGCTYPTEICRNTLIPSERTVQIVWKLLKEGRIYRLRLNPDEVPAELKPRMNYLWSIGVHGYSMFQKITWVIPTMQKVRRYNEDGEEVEEEAIESMAQAEDSVQRVAEE